MRLGKVKVRVAVIAAMLPVSIDAAHASEGGASFYLLGSGGPEAAVMPPVPGIFFDNTIYIYDGSASAERQFVVGGNVVAGLDATIVGDFPSLLWVPSTNFLGGTIGLGISVPFGAPMVDVEAVLTGPRGSQITRTLHDSALVVGDPVGTAVLGWKTGKFHTQIGATVNFPVGNYRQDALANLAFHRWIVDASLAAKWNDPKAGWDVSAKGGFTFNGRNDFTDYKTGTEFHLESSVEKTLSPAFSVGLQGYYFKQVTADSGSGAKLGPFKGEAAAIGVTAAFNTILGRAPGTFRVRGFKEFDVSNRLKGTAVFLSLSLPLHMEPPSEEQ